MSKKYVESSRYRQAASYSEPPEGVGEVGTTMGDDNTLSEIFEKSPLEESPVGDGEKREQREFDRPRDMIPQKQTVDIDEGSAPPPRSEITDRYSQPPRESSLNSYSSDELESDNSDILSLLIEQPEVILNSARNSYLVGEVSRDCYSEFKEAFDSAFSTNKEEDWKMAAEKFEELKRESVFNTEEKSRQLDQIVTEDEVEQF